MFNKLFTTRLVQSKFQLYCHLVSELQHRLRFILRWSAPDPAFQVDFLHLIGRVSTPATPKDQMLHQQEKQELPKDVEPKQQQENVRTRPVKRPTKLRTRTLTQEQLKRILRSRIHTNGIILHTKHGQSSKPVAFAMRMLPRALPRIHS